jgi:RNA polymerase sigma factor (TIGR02999 family)
MPMANTDEDITGWIRAWQDGDSAARDRVFDRLYGELKRLAAAVLRSESGHETLQPTALLNDALIKLIEASRAPGAEDRGHFARIVARAMRQILVDRARRKLADKRGAGEKALPLHEHDAAVDADPAQLVAVDTALATLARLDPRAAAVVELRVFAGLTIDEAAVALGISPSAVNREWAFACAWLKNDVFADG